MCSAVSGLSLAPASQRRFRGIFPLLDRVLPAHHSCFQPSESEADDELFKLNRIIMKACDKNPDRRYQTALDLRADLIELQQELRRGKISK